MYLYQYIVIYEYIYHISLSHQTSLLWCNLFVDYSVSGFLVSNLSH